MSTLTTPTGGAGSTFEPRPPTIYAPPTKIAADTYVIHQVQEALGEPLFVYLNSLVILGKEPVIVDTGTPGNRSQWMEDVFAIVEPDDVQWVFLSHDDVDHSGNLDQVMQRCPNAKLVCNWAMVERHSNCFNFPLERCRWIMHEESFDAGDRTLQALRPPVFDSPTTRGLFDSKTGVYWAVDTFATPLVQSFTLTYTSQVAPINLTLAARTKVVYGKGVTLHGLLRQGSLALGGQTVTLASKPFGSSVYTPFATPVTHLIGTYSTLVKPTMQTAYQASATGVTTPPTMTVFVSQLLKLSVRRSGGSLIRLWPSATVSPRS